MKTTQSVAICSNSKIKALDQFKASNNDTRAISIYVVMVSLLLTLSIFRVPIQFLCD